MVEVGHVERLQVHAPASASANAAKVRTRTAYRRWRSRESSMLRPIAARRASLVLVLATADHLGTEKIIVSGSRPALLHASRTLSRHRRRRWRARGNAPGVLGGQSWRSLRPQPPMMTGGPLSCTGFGSAGEPTIV
jgi:hypothetical protein